MDEERALAILYGNLKGPKKKKTNLMRIAKAARFLKNQYGSYTKVGEKIHATSEMVREFDHLLDLPKKVQDLLIAGKMGLDVGYKIYSKIKDDDRRTRVAHLVKNLTNRDARDVIYFAARNPRKSAEECKEKVLKSKEVKKEIHIMVIPLSEEDYNFLGKEAGKRETKPEDLAKKIIIDWIKSK